MFSNLIRSYSVLFHTVSNFIPLSSLTPDVKSLTLYALMRAASFAVVPSANLKRIPAVSLLDAAPPAMFSNMKLPSPSTDVWAWRVAIGAVVPIPTLPAVVTSAWPDDGLRVSVPVVVSPDTLT